jgi:hypothetical protein
MDDRVTITARLPRAIYDALKAEAERDERSMNQVLILTLRERFAATEIREAKVRHLQTLQGMREGL